MKTGRSFASGGMALLAAFALGTARGAVPISTDSGVFPLVSDGAAAPIFTSAEDHKVVGIAATGFADDVAAVAGVKPTVSQKAPSGSPVILIGTIGRSPLIDSLVSAGKLDVAAIQGKWETFVIQTITNPLPGISKALVVAGSDRRGTAYGVFDLSEGIGVSPWIWWADVAPATKNALWVNQTRYVGTSPAVKYRGFFLNDEDWGLKPWAAQTYDPAVGNIGPKTYAKIFELLLRLRANYLWPAMHNVTKAFNSYADNKQVADDYGIVMGSSHSEAMLRNNVGEWNTTTMGPWNYASNRTRIYQYWDQRAQTNGAFENIYTVGIRGLHDSAIEGASTTADRVALVQTALADQRQILAHRVNADVTQIPQVIVLYNEVLDLYQAGLSIPDDVTLMWPDDNHGYIRQLSGPAERARSGGAGVYYHLSYWGPPQDYLWLCTTPPAVIWSEMSKAYDSGATKMWIVNVGDLKPAELCTQFFLDLARDPEKFRSFDQLAYLKDWAGATFGAPFADSIGGILDRYYRLNHAIRPEHLNLEASGFSHVKNGDEAAQRMQAFARLAQDADNLSSEIPPALASAYYELVLYPVRCSHLMNQKVLLAERSRLYAQQRRRSTSSVAAAAAAAYDQIATETDYYNGSNVAGGKWNGMMHWHPRDRAAFKMPEVGAYAPPSDGPLGVAPEGSARTMDPGDVVNLPPFTPYADGNRFVDVFGTGTRARPWTAKASVPWITLSQTSGSTATDSRLLVGIDWAKAPHGYSISSPIVISDGQSADREVTVTIYHPPDLPAASVSGSVEKNGSIEIEAERFDRLTDRRNVGWKRIPGLGASDDAMSPYPALFAPFAAADLKNSAPLLEYDFYTFGRGSTLVQTICLPTYPLDGTSQGRIAIAVNDETPQVISANSGRWSVDVLRAATMNQTTHDVASAGKQTLKVWAVDPATVVDKFKITAPFVKGATSPRDFEAENLAAAAQTSGITYRTFDESGASNDKATVLESKSTGQFVTLILPHADAGTYDLSLRVKKLNNRGTVQLSTSSAAGGPFTDAGPPFDLYASSATYADVPPIRVTFSAGGPQYLRFAVSGKNASSGSCWICLDALSLDPVKLTKPTLSLARWKENFFGPAANADLTANDADWDGDGYVNLVEYATGSYPTETRSVPTLSLATGSSVITRFSRQAAAGDVSLTLQASGDLKIWDTLWTSDNAAASSEESVQQLEVTDPNAGSATKARFYRLRVNPK